MNEAMPNAKGRQKGGKKSLLPPKYSRMKTLYRVEASTGSTVEVRGLASAVVEQRYGPR